MKTLFSLFIFTILALPSFGHRRPNQGGYRPGGNQGGYGNPSMYSVNVPSGGSTFIQSWSNRGTRVWTVQSPGSTITARCFIRFRNQSCRSVSLEIAGQRFCTGVGFLPVIQADDSFQISYSSRGSRRRRLGFKCRINSSESTENSVDYDWSYSGNDGPDNWASTYPTCDGLNQSPINIETANTLGEFPWSALGLHGYDDPTARITLKNSGRAAGLKVQGPYIMGGNLPLNDRFALQYIIFHWGSSEHTVDGNSYAGEIQFIHVNMKYGDFENAAGQPDGFAALSVFLQLSQDDNDNLRPVTEALGNVQRAGSSVGLAYFPLSSLVPESYEDFYRYNGSLTHPSCDETVLWSVVKEPISISSNQLNQFRSLQDEVGNNILSNNRPVQDLNGRDVQSGQTAPSWSHHGPDGQDVWASEISPDCGGDKQSPVSIETSQTVVESSWPPLVFNNFDQAPENMTLHNNNNGVEILPSMGYRATIEGGPFESPFLLYHYHFHWGSPTTQGAEHVIDGRRYAGEMHLLIYQESLGFFASLGVKGALLEVAVFLELSPDDNPNFDSVITGLERVVPSLETTYITPFPLGNLLPNNRQDYFFYDGALTAPVPTCSELIDFMLFREPVPISRNQLSRFYNLENAAGYKIINNFRELQPLNGRTIYRSP